MIKHFLQGSWLKHPLHPALTHIPLALWPAALVFDLLSRGGLGGNDLVRASFYAIGLGLLAAFLALPTGLADWWDIKKERRAHLLGLYHLALNLVATAVWLANFIWRLPNLNAASVAGGPLALSIVGVLALFAGAYLGGRMVYAHGVSVARHSKEEWRQIAEAGGARLPARPNQSSDDNADDEDSNSDD